MDLFENKNTKYLVRALVSLNTEEECVAFLDEEPAESVVPVDQSRCGKCVYEVLVCGENDFYGNCPKYKRDPPDGGFYG